MDVGERTVQMDFMKIAVNVAREVPGGPNILADVLRGWFGPDAGHPGTWHQVRLSPGPPWSLTPVRRTGVERVDPVGDTEASGAPQAAAPGAIDGATG